MGFSRNISNNEFERYKEMVKYAPMVLSKAIITNIRNGNYKKISTKKWFKHKIHWNMDLYFLENILDSTTDYAKIDKSLSLAMPTYQFKVHYYKLIPTSKGNMYHLNIDVI